MKKVFVVFLLLNSTWLSGTPCFGQQSGWAWAQGDAGDLLHGGGSTCVGMSTASDSHGNIYVTGYFMGYTVTFGNITLENTSAGLSDIFVVKYDSTGKTLWAKKFGGSNIDQGNSIAVDLNDNILVTGGFASSTIAFGNTILSNPDLNTNMETAEFFLLKLDPNGLIMWVQRGVGTAYDYGHNLTTDNTGCIYVQGHFMSSTLQFGTEVVNGNGQGAVFITKYNSNGIVLWAKSLLAVETTEALGGGIAFDGNSHVYLTGDFGNASFSADNINVVNHHYESTSTTNPDIYLIKYDLNGNVIWANSYGGRHIDESNGVAVDAAGDVYITGSFISETLAFGNNILVNPPENIGLTPDIYLTKFDSDGTPLWARRAGNTYFNHSLDITINKRDQVFITGYIESFGLPSEEIVFGDIRKPVTGYGSNIFLAQYDVNGEATWFDFQSINGWNQGRDVATDSWGNVIITGVGGHGDYFGGYELPLQSSMFVAKLKPCLPPLREVASPVSICEGTSIVLTSPSATNNSWSTGSTDPSITVTQAGNYKVIVTTQSQCLTAILSTDVIINPLPDVFIFPSSDSMCAGNTMTLTATSAKTYLWNTGATSSSIAVTQPGSYQVRVTDSHDCAASSASVQIKQDPPPPDVELQSTCSQLFLDHETPVAWFKNDEMIFPTEAHLQTISPLDSGMFYVETSNVCGTKRSNVIHFKAPRVDLLFQPNVITPNGDAFNEYLVLDEKLSGSEVRIVNRWGNEVFYSPDYLNTWNGAELSEGIYYYIIQHSCFKEKIKGALTILR